MAGARDTHPGHIHTEMARPTPAEAKADLLATRGFGGVFAVAILVFAALTVLGLVGIFFRLEGGFEDRASWGYYAALVSFLLTTAGAAPMVAIAPALAKADWVRPVSRIATMFSLVGVVNAFLAIPLILALPPLVVEGFRRRSVWFEGPDYSPHVWAAVGLFGLAFTGLGLLWASAMPDLAAIRDTATGWRRRWAGKLASGFKGTDAQWRGLRMRIGMLGTLYFLLLIVTNYFIASDFAMSLVPGWVDAIFPMYHAMTALQGGVALTIVALFLVRHFGGLDRYIGIDQFWSLAKLLLATSLLWFYFFVSAFMVFWYSRTEPNLAVINTIIIGPYWPAFVGAFLMSFIIPWWLLVWNRVRVSIGGPTIAACIVLVGLFLDRIRLFVVSWQASMTDLHAHHIHDIPTAIWPDIFDVLIFLGAIGASALLVLLATRLLPTVSLWEMQQSLLLTRPARFLRGHVQVVGKPD